MWVRADCIAPVRLAVALCMPAVFSAGGQSGVDIPEDELPEDIYAGEEDELRPAAPTEVWLLRGACNTAAKTGIVCLYAQCVCVYVCHADSSLVCTDRHQV